MLPAIPDLPRMGEGKNGVAEADKSSNFLRAFECFQANQFNFLLLSTEINHGS